MDFLNHQQNYTSQCEKSHTERRITIKEYRFEKGIVRIHGQVNYEELKKACERFLERNQNGNHIIRTK